MKYESPKFEKVEFESADILMASGEAADEVKVENIANGTADFVISASSIFNK